MLRVRIEVVPHGRESGTEIIEEIFAGNDGTGGQEIGNYDIYTSDPRGRDYPREQRKGWVGRITRLERTRDHRLKLAAAAIGLVQRKRAEGR